MNARETITAAITSTEPGKALRALVDSGFMAREMPCVAAMDGVAQPKRFHPEGDVLEHTCAALNHAREMFERSPGSAEHEEVAWAVLLHDVGKAVSQTCGSDGRPQFIDHEDRSAEIILRELPRLGFDEQSMERIAQAARDHMRFLWLRGMRRGKQRALLGKPTAELNLAVLRCDAMSSGKDLDVLEAARCLRERFAREEEIMRDAPAPALTGKDLVAMGFKPGPIFREVIDATAGMDRGAALSAAARMLAESSAANDT
jgi:poly(A) polymerase